MKLIKMLLKFIFSVLEIKWTYATHSFKTTMKIVLYLNSFTLPNFGTENLFVRYNEVFALFKKG